MIRLTAYGDQPELYRYLSSIASNSIWQALDDWFGTPMSLKKYTWIISHHESG